MYDKILETKKAAKKIIKSKGIRRLDKYNLVKTELEQLSENERKILKKECIRDYESANRLSDIKDAISVFLTGITIINTVFGFFIKDKAIGTADYQQLIFELAIYIILMINILIAINLIKNSAMHLAKYMIDVLEDIE